MDFTNLISQYTNHPVLFIGTGFSMRYLKTSYSWEDLLKKISYELSSSDELYYDIKTKGERENVQFIFQYIASNLENVFENTLRADRNGKFKFINDKFFDFSRNSIHVSRFKLFISSLLQDCSDNALHDDEIKELKKARKNISSIITTNYDCFIEKIFEFKPLIGNDIILSNPYGSVYKIHGCVNQPEKIVVTERDYEIFNNKYELIRAQLLSLFIHNPIIFIGYGMGDDNIRCILKTIFSYIDKNSDLAQKVKSNFLIVEYEKMSSNTEVSEYDISINSDTIISVNKIKTDNFIDIYRAISNLNLPVSTMDIRKVQNVFKEIQEGGKIQVNIVSDLDNLSNNEKILAIGNKSNIKFEYQTSGEMISNYFKIIDEDNKNLLNLIDKHDISSNQFFPIFAFSKINNSIKKESVLKNQQIYKLKIYTDKIKGNLRKKFYTIEDILNSREIPESSKPFVLLWNIYYKNIDLINVELFLREYTDKRSTDFRRYLCAYDLLKYK